MLYSTSWEVRKAKIERDVGIQAAAAGVLHTWNQRLEHHPHIHFVVPGNGPSIDGTKWIDCRMTKGTVANPAKPFLVDNKDLGREFRDLFLQRLAKKIEQGTIVPIDLTATDSDQPNVTSQKLAPSHNQQSRRFKFCPPVANRPVFAVE